MPASWLISTTAVSLLRTHTAPVSTAIFLFFIFFFFFRAFVSEMLSWKWRRVWTSHCSFQDFGICWLIEHVMTVALVTRVADRENVCIPQRITLLAHLSRPPIQIVQKRTESCNCHLLCKTDPFGLSNKNHTRICFFSFFFFYFLKIRMKEQQQVCVNVGEIYLLWF